jgi:AcrR family transcriptional regulator
MPPKPLPQHTRAALIAAARGVAAKRGSTRLPLSVFCAATGINPARIYARFDDWPTLCAEAGLVPGIKPPSVSSARLLADLHAVIVEAGGFERSATLLRRVPASPATYYRRFGDWAGILRALRDWVAAHAPDFPYGRELDRRLANQERRKPRGGVAPLKTATRPPWRSTGARASGAPLAFRGMASAPVNEMGVVLAFGMLAADLGYAVEAIGTAFPDCQAKRLVAGAAGGKSGAGDRWEPVRIEFEFRSRSFLYHGHDADECDVLICWQHDWPDCPLEVLVLEDVVAGLMARDGAGKARAQAKVA